MENTTHRLSVVVISTPAFMSGPSPSHRSKSFRGTSLRLGQEACQELSVNLEVPNDTEVNSKKKISTTVQLFARLRKKSNQSTVSSPFVSSCELLEFNGELASQPTSSDQWVCFYFFWSVLPMNTFLTQQHILDAHLWHLNHLQFLQNPQKALVLRLLPLFVTWDCQNLQFTPKQSQLCPRRSHLPLLSLLPMSRVLLMAVSLLQQPPGVRGC